MHIWLWIWWKTIRHWLHNTVCGVAIKLYITHGGWVVDWLLASDGWVVERALWPCRSLIMRDEYGRLWSLVYELMGTIGVFSVMRRRRGIDYWLAYISLNKHQRKISPLEFVKFCVQNEFLVFSFRSSSSSSSHLPSWCVCAFTPKRRMGGIRSLATAYQTNQSVTLETTATASTYQIPIATSQDQNKTL